MTEPELLELQYAALIHDIGQLSLQDPIPAGPPSVSAEDQRRIAELGAEVIEQATMLDSVAEIMRPAERSVRGPRPYGAFPARPVPARGGRPSAAEQPYHPGRQRLR